LTASIAGGKKTLWKSNPERAEYLNLLNAVGFYFAIGILLNTQTNPLTFYFPKNITFAT